MTFLGAAIIWMSAIDAVGERRLIRKWPKRILCRVTEKKSAACPPLTQLGHRNRPTQGAIWLSFGLQTNDLNEGRVDGELFFDVRREITPCHHRRIDFQADSLSRTPLACSALSVSSCSVSRIGNTVFAGANRPNQIGYSASANPASRVVGTSGNVAARSVPLTARAVSLPACTSGRTRPPGRRRSRRVRLSPRPWLQLRL